MWGMRALLLLAGLAGGCRHAAPYQIERETPLRSALFRPREAQDRTRSEDFTKEEGIMLQNAAQPRGYLPGVIFPLFGALVAAWGASGPSLLVISSL